jgi:uracil-DNA glycosylase family 4
MTFLLVFRQSYHCSVKTRKSPRFRRPSSLSATRAAIIGCARCPRLRRYCRAVAAEKRAAYRNWEYWGRPVPGFGDPHARVLILGLAPAAHGANRTGRVFTGDGAGGSGDFLMAALHRAGLANLPTSVHQDDGLALRDVFIAAAVRCAPPGNKPTPEEVTRCLDHLESELTHLARIDTVVALGKIAWDAWLELLSRHLTLPRPRPVFGHGKRVTWPALPPAANGGVSIGPVRGHMLIGCYHPSRQNTNTGRVTPAMYDEVFGRLL